MSDQCSQTPKSEDYMNILSAFAIKRHTAALGGIRVCLQINKPENKELYYSGQENSRVEDQVLCIQELKLKLLAKSAICPGIITMIWSLITSSSIGIDMEEVDDEIIEYINRPGRSISQAPSYQGMSANHSSMGSSP
jgi:hypothetical protein